MNLEQITSATLNNLQMLLEQKDIPLAVGPITNADFQAMMTAYAELNWDFAFNGYGNNQNKFEFCVKLVGETNPLPAGAALSVYNIDINSFDICFVESFVRNNADHPLHGRMIVITLIAAYMFCTAVDCQVINVIEPVNVQVIALYQGFGFKGDTVLMTASRDQIRKSILSYTSILDGQSGF
ncbi:hypothetical protein [Serratia symbiotica]|uniref:hypothetical protein n=1 Tax=Serratia symbiotica TaxID=138074 RepID=UPI0004ABFFCB|nr:hypothetical protein [Serratia symbiotica]CDS57793.1 conserved hypothetical protein [Serratia symbiotica]